MFVPETHAAYALYLLSAKKVKSKLWAENVQGKFWRYSISKSYITPQGSLFIFFFFVRSEAQPSGKVEQKKNPRFAPKNKKKTKFYKSQTRK